MQSITSKCGPGKYRVRGFNTKGRYIGMKTISIAEAAEVPPAAANSTSLQDMLALMREERARSKDDMYKWATLIVPALAPFLPEMVKGMFGRGTSLADLTTALANMKQLAGNDSSQLSKVEEFARMVEVIKGITGAEKESSGKTIYDLIDTGIREAMPAITGIVAARRGIAPPVVNPTAIPAPPQLPPAALAGTKPEAPMNPLFALAQWFGQQLPSLTVKAAKDSDPELYAEVLLDSVPDGMDARMLRDILARPDWWTQLTTFYPQASPYQGWFTSLRDSMISMVEQEINASLRQQPPEPETISNE
jgi:hypothetical protein